MPRPVRKSAMSTASPTVASPKKKTPSKAKSNVGKETKEKEKLDTPKPKRAKVDTSADSEGSTPVDGADADVFITSSKACQAFKVRAEEIQRLVKQAKPDAKVFINAEKKLGTKPDRGTFAVSVKGKMLVELKAIPRPFAAMKALVMKDLADQVITELA